MDYSSEKIEDMDKNLKFHLYLTVLFSLISLAFIAFALLTIENYRYTDKHAVTKFIGYLILLYIVIQPIIIYIRKNSYSIIELKSEGNKKNIINKIVVFIPNLSILFLGTYFVFTTNNNTYESFGFAKLIWSVLLIGELILANYFPIIKFKNKSGIYNDHTILEEKIWRIVHQHASKVFTIINIISIFIIWYFNHHFATFLVIIIFILKRKYMANYSEKIAREIYLKKS